MFFIAQFCVYKNTKIHAEVLSLNSGATNFFYQSFTNCFLRPMFNKIYLSAFMDDEFC